MRSQHYYYTFMQLLLYTHIATTINSYRYYYKFISLLLYVYFATISMLNVGIATNILSHSQYYAFILLLLYIHTVTGANSLLCFCAFIRLLLSLHYRHSTTGVTNYRVTRQMIQPHKYYQHRFTTLLTYVRYTTRILLPYYKRAFSTYHNIATILCFHIVTTMYSDQNCYIFIPLLLYNILTQFHDVNNIGS